MQLGRIRQVLMWIIWIFCFLLVLWLGCSMTLCRGYARHIGQNMRATFAPLYILPLYLPLYSYSRNGRDASKWSPSSLVDLQGGWWLMNINTRVMTPSFNLFPRRGHRGHAGI